ncbi:TetR/AcrR family transcriptional regulator [Nesterenkonia xinjiangensis]|uniref:AcrR family transcriptional regulator n=1 Tax=Nesterenkonia xinjiangensis TaxID=225327 RepID=A0A7Z0GKK3_9MICC|nr:TetR family transcriptional regulator [Nesterenkonia xinjiangensis]NYJ77732.1 AcrR family transcriptional regulator [Nesterenkonia xinjiangensis]
MRQSKRTEILHAAQHIVQRDGVTAITYESVAAEAGLTKGGLLYHFPSREDMLLALHEHVAGQWEACMESEAGAPYEELTPGQRLDAYIRASQNPDRAELLLMLESAGDPAAQAAWDTVHDRWSPPPPRGTPDDADVPGRAAGVDPDLLPFLARLAADGLWFYEALAPGHFTEAQRSTIVEAIIRLGAGEHTQT